MEKLVLANNELSYRQQLFAEKVSHSPNSTCWEWRGAKSSRGAGTFGLGELGVRSAHTAAWILFRDPSYAAEQEARFQHLCGNNGCVNPRHLAIIGADGLENPKEVAMFLADSFPEASASLLDPAAKLPSNIRLRDPARTTLPAAADVSALLSTTVDWLKKHVDWEWDEREIANPLNMTVYLTGTALAWSVTIALESTPLEHKALPDYQEGVEGSPAGWMLCQWEGGTFRGWADLGNLAGVLRVFLEQAGK